MNLRDVLPESSPLHDDRLRWTMLWRHDGDGVIGNSRGEVYPNNTQGIRVLSTGETFNVVLLPEEGLEKPQVLPEGMWHYNVYRHTPMKATVQPEDFSPFDTMHTETITLVRICFSFPRTGRSIALVLGFDPVAKQWYITPSETKVYERGDVDWHGNEEVEHSYESDGSSKCKQCRHEVVSKCHVLLIR